MIFLKEHVEGIFCGVIILHGIEDWPVSRNINSILVQLLKSHSRKSSLNEVAFLEPQYWKQR